MTRQNSLPVTPVGADALEQVISLLPKLSQADLKVVLTAIDRQLGNRSDIDLVLFHLLFEVVGLKPLSIGMFSNSSNGALWRKNIVCLHNLVAKLTAGKDVRRAGLTAIHKNLFQLLVEYINERAEQKIGAPLTLKTVCHEIANIQAVYELSFPGYLRSELGRSLYLKGLGAI